MYYQAIDLSEQFFFSCVINHAYKMCSRAMKRGSSVLSALAKQNNPKSTQGKREDRCREQENGQAQ